MAGFTADHADIDDRGMAVVYLARDPVLGRAVALKVMRVGGDEPGASRLVREGQALARISLGRRFLARQPELASGAPERAT